MCRSGDWLRQAEAALKQVKDLLKMEIIGLVVFFTTGCGICG